MVTSRGWRRRTPTSPSCRTCWSDGLAAARLEPDPLEVVDARWNIVDRVGRLVLEIVVPDTGRLRGLHPSRPVALPLADHRLQRVGQSARERAARDAGLHVLDVHQLEAAGILAEQRCGVDAW